MQLNINNSKPESRKKETQFRINDIKEEILNLKNTYEQSL